MHDNSHSLLQLLIIFGAAVVFVPVARRLGLGSIIGYLAAGMLIGPSVLGFVDDVDTIAYIAEFGVVFLLFLIGIEMKPQRLWTMRRLILGLGGAQILLTAVVLAIGAWALGVTGAATVIIGLGLALSSTAMGLQMLSDRKEFQTSTGRTSFSILLMQDLAVPVLLALVAVMAGGRDSLSGGLVLLGIVEGVAILLATFLFSRYALKHVLAQIAAARVTEVFTTFALLLVLGMAWLMEYVGLSLAMGAFLAGVFLADSEYRHQIEADIQPFRGLLLGLFFMGVGMGIDLGLLIDRAVFILGLALILMLLKAGIIAGLAHLFGLSAREGLHAGSYLSQMGEFGFVLFAFAASEGVIGSDQLAILVLVIAVSMALTPVLVPQMLRLVDKTVKRSGHPESDLASVSIDTPEEGYSFIIAGYGRVGQAIASQLATAGYNYIAFDTNPAKVRLGRDLGMNVHFGDARRMDVLQAARARSAKGLILTMDDKEDTMRAVRQIRDHFPNIPIHARAHDLSEAAELRHHGASASVPETIEASFQLGLCAVSNHPDADSERAEKFREQIGKSRDNGYKDVLEYYTPQKLDD